jgi:hypothetical protein
MVDKECAGWATRFVSGYETSYSVPRHKPEPRPAMSENGCSVIYAQCSGVIVVRGQM